MILSQAFSTAALKNPNHPAIVDLGKAVSYGELKKRIAQLSYLYQAEIPSGETCAFLVTSRTAVIQTIFALSNTGNPFTFFNPADDNESLLEDMKNLEVKHLMVTGDQLARARDLVRAYGSTVNIVEIEKKRGGEYDTSYSPPPERPQKETDSVLILRHEEYGEERTYIYFSHKQIYASVNSLRRFYQLTPSDRFLTSMHWSHPFALTHAVFLPLFYGSTCVPDPDLPSVEEVVEFLAKERVTRFIGPPNYFYQLLSYCAAKKYTLPGVKSVTVGAGTMSLSLRKTFRLLKVPVMRCYGRTEALWSVAMDDLEGASDIEHARSAPVTGIRCKVLDENLDEVPGEEMREGLLAFMSPSAMTEFYHPDKEMAAQATRNRLRGTWIYTDEIARLDGGEKEMKIAVLGKASDMIKVNNRYLSPRQIDDVAKECTDIADAAGFVKIQKDGEKIFACAVVPAVKAVDERGLMQRFKEKLPAEIVPQEIHAVDSIPRNAFEVVNRKALQKQFSGL